MGIRVQWQSEVPAGADGETNWVLGSVPEGKRLIVSGASYYGGDGGERYGINLIPAGNYSSGSSVDMDSGQIAWSYPMAGGTQTNATPVPVTQYYPAMLMPIPGPCTITISTVAASAAKLVVNMVGILEDL